MRCNTRSTRRPAMYTRSPLNAWMNDALHSPVNDLVKETRRVRTRPSVNITENEDGFSIQMAIPGYTKEQVDIRLKDSMLTVTNRETEDGTKKYRLQEFDYRSFARTFRLDKTIDINSIQAKMDQGVLTIELKKREEVKPRTITIS